MVLAGFLFCSAFIEIRLMDVSYRCFLPTNALIGK
jgi:hypothetical protein